MMWCGVYRFETCWPAIAKDASGVILVSNATQIRDLEPWFVLLWFHCDWMSICSIVLLLLKVGH